jgi:hypothetical protein
MKPVRFKQYGADELETVCRSKDNEMWMNVERAPDGTFRFHITSFCDPTHAVTISPKGAEQLRKFLKP